MNEIEIVLRPLFLILDQIEPLNNELREALMKRFKVENVSKTTVLLHEGAICNKLWFLAEGLLRAYHEIDDKDITSRIMFTNHIVIAPGSFFKQKPATESIETLTDSTVAAISFEDLQFIYKQFPQFNYHTRLIIEDYFYKQEQRLYMLRKKDALAKYLYFQENYSLYNDVIPHKHIASFLNIARETFVRLRKKCYH